MPTEPVDVVQRTYTAELVEGDGRTIVGRCVPYDSPADVADGPDGRPYREVWRPGAFRNVVKSPHRTTLNYDHRDDLPNLIGHAVALEEHDDGLHATFRAMPGTSGDQALELIRSGIATGLSIHAWVSPRGTRRNTDGTVERVLAARLPHVALCREPAYAGAGVTAVRSIGGADGTAPRVEIPATVAEVLAYTSAARARYAPS